MGSEEHRILMEQIAEAIELENQNYEANIDQQDICNDMYICDIVSENDNLICPQCRFTQSYIDLIKNFNVIL